jgi:hypothetical protein
MIGNTFLRRTVSARTVVDFSQSNGREKEGEEKRSGLNFE